MAADGLGRPSTPLSINVGVRALMGIEIDVEVIRVAGVSLQGEVLCSASEPLAALRAARRSAARRRRWWRGPMRSWPRAGRGWRASASACRARWTPPPAWCASRPTWAGATLDLLPLLTEALAAAGLPPVPVQLQNEADAAALGEFEFGENGEGEDPLIFVNCDVGVGAGIVLNDRLFIGAQGMAGEIGHTILQVDGPLLLLRPTGLRRGLLRLARARAARVPTCRAPPPSWACCCRTCGSPSTRA